MNIFLTFTRRCLKENKMRTIVTIIGIILSMSLFTAVIEGAYSGLSFLRRCEIDSLGSWHGYVENLSYDEYEKLLEDPMVGRHTSWQEVGWADCGSSNTYKPYVVIESIPEALACTERVCSSVNVASTKAGINMDAVAEMGRIIKKTAELTRDTDGLGCAKLVVFANAVEDNPFMAGAFHGVGEPECVLNVGVSGPGVVHHALQSVRGQPFDVVAETIKKTAFQVTRMGQLVGMEASRRLGIPFGIVDLSLAPTPAVGDSVARILEEMGLEVCGTHGTTAALANALHA